MPKRRRKRRGRIVEMSFKADQGPKLIINLSDVPIVGEKNKKRTENNIYYCT